MKFAFAAAWFGAIAAAWLGATAAHAAPDTDYAAFARLAQPLHVVDRLVAAQHQTVRGNAQLSVLSPKWRATYYAAVTRGIEAHRADISDTIMRNAFPGFSHDDVQRLGALADQPYIARFLTGWVALLMDDGSDIEAGRIRVQQALTTDADFAALAPSDRQLLGRVISATDGSQALANTMQPIIHDAVTEADTAVGE